MLELCIFITRVPEQFWNMMNLVHFLIFSFVLCTGMGADCINDAVGSVTSCANSTMSTINTATGTMPMISHQHQSSFTSSSTSGVSEYNSVVSGENYSAQLYLRIFSLLDFRR